MAAHVESYRNTIASGRAGSQTGILLLGVILLAVGGLISVWWGGTFVLFRFIFPATALLIGGLLFVTYPILYVGFVWWLWMLTPMIRRIIDLYAGWADPNPVLLTPYLVTAFSAFTLLQNINCLGLRKYLPITLALAAIIYGYVIGLIQLSVFAATLDLLDWIMPVLLAFHISVNWKDYKQHAKVIERTFTWGVLFMGLYALVQFFYLLEWDQFWAINSEMGSLGKPEALKIRIFSTLNAPAPFGHVMMSGLLLLLVGRGMFSILAAIPGYAAFLLSLSRQSWGGWFVGLLVVASQATGRLRSRLVTVIILGGIILLPLITTEAIFNTISNRFLTISNIEEDSSLGARISSYKGVALRIINAPQGYGMGMTGSAQRLDSGAPGMAASLDSGILDIALALGWPGAALYFSALAMILLTFVRHRRICVDPVALASIGIVVAMEAMLALGKTQKDVSGIVMWTFIGLGIAAVEYHKSGKVSFD